MTCRVLKLARQPYYRWLANPITDAEYVEAHRANALFDAHRDDPEFGYRFWSMKPATPVSRWPSARRGRSAQITAGGVRSASVNAARTARPDRLCTMIWSSRDFTADAPNWLWLADITEHVTGAGKLYPVCDQGAASVLKPDRRLQHRLLDEIPAGHPGTQ